MTAIRNRGLWTLVAIAVATVALACSSEPEDSSTPQPALSDDPNVGVHERRWEEFRWALSDESASHAADLIFVATVNPPGDPFWTTISGERPGVTLDGRLPEVPADQLRWGKEPQILTPWTFTVDQILKGELPESGPVVVNRWGGEIPPDTFAQEFEIAFYPGNEIVLFLRDCGQGDVDSYGTPYEFIKRQLITPNGYVASYIGGPLITLDDLLEVVDQEKDQLPEYEWSCPGT